MKLGWCGPIENAALIARVGFDFIEVPLAPLGLEKQASLAAAKMAIASCPLPTWAFNQFLPRDLRVVGTNKLRRCSWTFLEAPSLPVGVSVDYTTNGPREHNLRNRAIWMSANSRGSKQRLGLRNYNQCVAEHDRKSRVEGDFYSSFFGVAFIERA
jgi:hypothetical protein